MAHRTKNVLFYLKKWYTKDAKNLGGRIMSTAYEKAFEIELLSEYSSMVYAEALNYMLDHDLEHTKPNHFLVDLVKQMELNLSKDLFTKELEEIQAISAYWRVMHKLFQESFQVFH